MAEEDELFYLQPGFDLNTLTIPRIRSILVSHNISYPASAKKAQLVEIVEQELIPNARKLLKAQARVRRTSKGITDVPSSQDSTIDDDEDEDKELMPPPPAPKTPRSRKSKSNLTENGAATTPVTTRRSKTPSARRTTAGATRVSDTETDADKQQPSTRKVRKSAPAQATVPQSVKIDEPDLRMKRESLQDGGSPFSDDNPFQSASSPSSGSRRVSSTSRTRKSLDTDRRKSTSKRRQTSSPTIVKREEEGTSSRSSYRIPVARINSDEPEDGVMVTEEFTPDAAQELQEEERANGQLVRKRTTALTRRKKKPTSTAVKAAPWTVLTAVVAAIGAWYRQEKINVGYCGVGEPNWSLSSNPNIPAWVHESFQPACEPCPPHAICYPNMDVRCDTDFVLKPHPLSLSSVVPLPPTCEPDSEKERRIKSVADRAVDALRDQRALYECGDDYGKDHDNIVTDVKTVTTAGVTKVEISEEALKTELSKQRRKGMTADEFEDLWRGAMGNVESREEITVIHDGSGRKLLSSSSLARLPFTCAIRRSLVRSVQQNRLPISLVILISLAMVYGRKRIVSYNQATAQIPHLVATTLDRLATQAALKEDGRVGEGFIAVGQLRDDVLRNVFSVRERERVWQGVRKVVEGNSNVRAATREGGKTGEWSRVWEWIGPVDLAPALEGRRSGGFLMDSPVANGAAGGLGSTKEDLAMRKWDEGRPIY